MVHVWCSCRVALGAKDGQGPRYVLHWFVDTHETIHKSEELTTPRAIRRSVLGTMQWLVVCAIVFLLRHMGSLRKIDAWRPGRVQLTH